MKWCGNGRPRDITSSGNVVFVTFRTDGNSTRKNITIHIDYRGIIAVDGKPHGINRTHIKSPIALRQRTIPQPKAFNLLRDAGGQNGDVSLMGYLLADELWHM